MGTATLELCKCDSKSLHVWHTNAPGVGKFTPKYENSAGGRVEEVRAGEDLGRGLAGTEVDDEDPAGGSVEEGRTGEDLGKGVAGEEVDDEDPVRGDDAIVLGNFDNAVSHSSSESTIGSVAST